MVFLQTQIFAQDEPGAGFCTERTGGAEICRALLLCPWCGAEGCTALVLRSALSLKVRDDLRRFLGAAGERLGDATGIRLPNLIDAGMHQVM